MEGCKGLYWRGSVSRYLSSHNSIEERISLRFLKRLSCTGCPQCAWLWDELREHIPFQYDYKKEPVEHGALYTYHVETSHGYYDSYPEIEDMYFVKVKEED